MLSVHKADFKDWRIKKWYNFSDNNRILSWAADITRDLQSGDSAGSRNIQKYVTCLGYSDSG